MDAEQFRRYGHDMIDFVAEYLENTDKYNVLPDVEPGYLSKRLPDEAPFSGEQWKDIFRDVHDHILPGVTHFQSPHYHAYFPAMTSYPSILGEIMSSAINCIGFSWINSPACTELETIVLDWIGKMVGLPADFLASPELSSGGGSIQGSASEALVVSIVSAREQALKKLKKEHPELKEFEILSRLIAYQSDQTHSSFVKGCKILSINSRALETNDEHGLEGPTLHKAVEEDLAKGLFPFFLCATLGTTGTCAFDKIADLGPICNDNSIWMHIDAAYAGIFCICPENRTWLNGVEFADSFNTNASKAMMTNFDASLLWVKSLAKIMSAMNTQFSIYENKYTGSVIDYKDMQLPLGRRFRALKLWFVVRSYGVDGLEKLLRKTTGQAELFTTFVLADDRFELLGHKLGLVTFCVKGSNEVNRAVNNLISDGKKIFMTSAVIKGRTVLRFVVCPVEGGDEHLYFAWGIISAAAGSILKKGLTSNGQQSDGK